MRHCGWILGLLLLLPVPGAFAAQGASQPPAAPEAKAPDIAAEASGPLGAMCEYLKTRPAFTFTADVETDEVYPNGQTLQVSRTVSTAVKRPDKAFSRVVGDDRDRVFVYDGKTVTIADLDRGVYAVTDAPPTLDATIDMLEDKYGLHAPLGDLVQSDPCTVLLEHVRTGDYAGRHTAAGKTCDHLAFTQKAADWQLWVEQGKEPLPRKFVIIDKDIMGWPQYEATFRDWDVNPRLKPELFTFKPAAGMRRIEFAPLVHDADKTK